MINTSFKGSSRFDIAGKKLPLHPPPLQQRPNQDSTVFVDPGRRRREQVINSGEREREAEAAL